MVKFNRHTLSNGLKLLVHEDTTTPMAVVNILYDVGSRDEHPDKTGLAHLLEHLMFSGSIHIPSYDQALQKVGGNNNAFTTHDFTNYYISLPVNNLETAFWLESDRMLGLAFSEKNLSVQRNVVCEEFKERYLNQPFGDVWMHLCPMVYKQHPYQWPIIGKSLAHIENARLEDVQAFFTKYYNPSNAILVVGGAVVTEQVKILAEKWFGNIPLGKKYMRHIPGEPKQQEARRKEVASKVPSAGLYMAFQMPARKDATYYAVDLLADLLGSGRSARLFSNLVKTKQLFSEIDVSISESFDAGIFLIEGKPLRDISIEQAETAVWEELAMLTREPIAHDELTKVKNAVESSKLFSELSLLHKAIHLAYYELLGDAEELNLETQKYLAVTPEDIQQAAQEVFCKENSSTLIYLAEHND